MKIEKEYTDAGSYDVVVCGGGPAGVAAAVAAARAGASTLLLEGDGCLGGLWTSGLMTWVIESENKPGIMQEMREWLKKNAEGQDNPSGPFSADTEYTKYYFEQLVLRAGVHIRLHTMVTGVIRDGRRITHVTTESKSGAECFAAKMVIDTTGDGDVGAEAGCRYELGNKNGETQPMTMTIQVSGIHAADIANFDVRKGNALQRNLLQEFEKAGVDPSYRNTFLACLAPKKELYAMMINHEYGYKADNADDLTRATIEGRAEVIHSIEALRNLGGVWEHLALNTTAPRIGVREGRRILGRYVVTIDDMLVGKRQPDGVCEVHFPIDVHGLKKNATGFDDLNATHSLPYEIPLRALIAEDVDGLLMGGRCISGDFAAHSSYRVGGNAVRTGEAAGIAAAYSALHGILPQDIPDIRQLL